MRPTYSARQGGARRPGRAYRGVDRGKPVTPPIIVPEGPGLFQCPVCKGYVKLVGAPYSNPEIGVKQGKTKVMGSHKFGGHPSGRGPCIGAGWVYKPTA